MNSGSGAVASGSGLSNKKEALRNAQYGAYNNNSYDAAIAGGMHGSPNNY